MAPLTFPAGRVKTHRPNQNNPYDIPWTNVSRWEPSFSQAAAESDVDVSLIIAMAIVESDANQYRTLADSGTPSQVIEVHDAFGGGPSVGIMQVKPLLHQAALPDADAHTPHGNIRLGARLMRNFIHETGSWQNAIRLKYHPGVSAAGTTPEDYVATIVALRAEFEAADTAHEPVEPVRHPLDIITNGAAWTADFGFGMLNFHANGSPANFYHYGVGHGTTAANAHPGIDVNVPLGTVLHTPLAGVVRCVGDVGHSDWGQGCGAFPDELTGGVGNVTVRTDVGLKLTFGHVNQPLVAVDQRVEAGQAVTTSGGMLGPHLHLDVAIRAPERVNHAIAFFGGEYFLLDPVPALQRVIGGAVGLTQTCPPFAPPEFDGTEKVIGSVVFHPDRRTVEIEVEELNCRQFAILDACLTRDPLRRGETVDVLYWIRGEAVDGEDRWWVAADGSRIWSGGTVQTPQGG